MTVDLRVATFNLGNLAEAGAQIYETEPRTPEEAAGKFDFLSDLLRRIDADIIAVQEVVHEAALRKVAAGLFEREQVLCPLPSDVTEDEARSPRVGLLTRPGLVWSRLHRNLPCPQDVLGLRIEEFRRPVLEVDIEVRRRQLRVFVTHLKSPRPLFLDEEPQDDPILWALAMARARAVRGVEVAGLKQLCAEAAQTRPVMLLGDLNADSNSATLQALRGRRPPEDAEPEARARAAAAQLFDTTRLARRAGGFALGPSYFYAGHPQTIDHVLVSHHFTSWSPTPVGTVRSVRTLSDHLGPETHTLVRHASDHAPVVAHIELL